jgi:cysteine-rich repeat protein
MERLALVVLLACAGCLDWQELYGEACTDCEADPEAPASCGNGQVEAGEACDDGDRDDGDGCRNDCSWARCGDGVVRANVEECDDGNGDDSDGCTSRCLACAPSARTFTWATSQSCYDHFPDKLTLAAASAFCAERRFGSLLMLELNDEELVLEDALGGAQARALWLGLTRRRDSFVWLSGRPLGRTFWAEDEPAAPPADCVMQVLGAAPASSDAQASFTWEARECGESHGFVCERSPPVLRAETNHAYIIGYHAATWAEARQLCELEGAHLATLDSEAEHALAALPGATNVWLGGEAMREPRAFAWITGEPFDYERFSPADKPDDDAAQRCLLLGDDGYWYDKECDARYAYLCELD